MTLTTTQLHPCKIDMEPNNEGLVQRIFLLKQVMFRFRFLIFQGATVKQLNINRLRYAKNQPQSHQWSIPNNPRLCEDPGEGGRQGKNARKQLNPVVVSKMIFSDFFTSNPLGKMIPIFFSTCALLIDVFCHSGGRKGTNCPHGNPTTIFHGFRGWLSYKRQYV